MSKINKMMADAVKAGKRFKSKNTIVTIDTINYKMFIRVFLFDNLIYRETRDIRYEDDVKEFTLAGWNTMTTRSRLNALGINVCNYRKQPYHNGKKIDCEKWYQVK